MATYGKRCQLHWRKLCSPLAPCLAWHLSCAALFPQDKMTCLWVILLMEPSVHRGIKNFLFAAFWQQPFVNNWIKSKEFFLSLRWHSEQSSLKATNKSWNDIHLGYWDPFSLLDGMQNNYGCTTLAAVVKHKIFKPDWWIFEYSDLTLKTWPHLSLWKPSARTIKLLGKLRNILRKKKKRFSYWSSLRYGNDCTMCYSQSDTKHLEMKALNYFAVSHE